VYLPAPVVLPAASIIAIGLPMMEKSVISNQQSATSNQLTTTVILSGALAGFFLDSFANRASAGSKDLRFVQAKRSTAAQTHFVSTNSSFSPFCSAASAARIA
jgi:hypothetical protein